MSDENISKFLSLILRHEPQLIKLDMDENGWVTIAQIIENAKLYKKKELSFDQIFDVVKTNDKQRFVIDNTNKKIRANQGHSININLGLTAKIPPNLLFHGTATRFLPSIEKEGIKSMARQHVHLSSTIETAISVGKRHGKPIILEINAKEMQEDGFIFYISENNVWLVDTVPYKYIKQRAIANG